MYIWLYGNVAIMNNQNVTLEKANQIISKGNQINQTELHTFKVKSQTGTNEYVVTNNNEWDCTCPDYTYRHAKCKHI